MPRSAVWRTVWPNVVILHFIVFYIHFAVETSDNLYLFAIARNPEQHDRISFPNEIPVNVQSCNNCKRHS